MWRVRRAGCSARTASWRSIRRCATSRDRKSTRLNSSHGYISYAVFSLKKNNELNQDDARYGFRCCHLKNIWTAPPPPETELSRQMTTSTTSIDILGLQAAYANLHTDQERDYFMKCYYDSISSVGCKTSYDADNRPLLVMRSNLWASGYDVDGTHQTSLVFFSSRVQQIDIYSLSLHDALPI